MHTGWFYRLHETLKPVFGNWVAANDRNGYFYQFATREVQAARHNRGNDMVAQLFTAQKSKPELSDINIAYMMTSNVFAGSDTTSTSLRAIFYLLGKHPRVLEKLVHELENKKKSNQLSDPVSFNEAESCAYLQAVIYEAMRLYPAAGDLMDRDVPARGMLINNRYVPAGVRHPPTSVHASRADPPDCCRDIHVGYPSSPRDMGSGFRGIPPGEMVGKRQR